MGEVVDFPHADPVPKPTGDTYLDLIEMRIFSFVVEYVQTRRGIETAKGLALARADYLSCHLDLSAEPVDGDRFVVAVITALHGISARQQAKVRHPARSRAEAQLLLEGGTL